MTSDQRPGDGSGIEDPNIRDGIDNPDLRQGVDNPEIRQGIDNPELRQGVDNPDLRQGVDNPDLRQGVDNPNLRQGVGNPDIRPGSQLSGGGLSLGLPKLLVLGVGAVVIAVGAIMVLNSGGGGPGASKGPGTTSGAGTASCDSPPSAAADGTAKLVICGDVSGSWTLDANSGDVSPTTTLIAAVWVETVDNVPAGYGDLITISMGGPIASGATSQAGVSLGFGINRSNAAGADLFDHQFSSRAGECQVTMARGSTGVTGTFTCGSITSADGKTVKAVASFAT